MFAGTGNKSNDLPQPPIQTPNKASSIEKSLIGMIADISKVRIGDKVIFYVMGCKKFYGVFEIAGSPFYENFSLAQNNYLYNPELNKKNLTFKLESGHILFIQKELMNIKH